MFETTYGMTGHFRLPGLTLATNRTDFAKSIENYYVFRTLETIHRLFHTNFWGANIGDNWCSYPSLYGDSWEGSKKKKHVDKQIFTFRFWIHIWEFSYFTCQFMTVASIILHWIFLRQKLGFFGEGIPTSCPTKPLGVTFIVSSSSY